LHGEHVQTDIRKGVQLIKKAALAGVPDALYDLAFAYESGSGVKKSRPRAARYYLEAALSGNAQSVYEIGRLYFYGEGVAKDREIAKVWLARAKVLGVE
jgi:hypothetical protein